MASSANFIYHRHKNVSTNGRTFSIVILVPLLIKTGIGISPAPKKGSTTKNVGVLKQT